MTIIELPFDELMARMERLEAKLDRLLPPEPMWTTRDVAAYLKCAEETVRVRARSGELPVASRSGNRMLFDPLAVKALSK